MLKLPLPYPTGRIGKLMEYNGNAFRGRWFSNAAGDDAQFRAHSKTNEIQFLSPQAKPSAPLTRGRDLTAMSFFWLTIGSPTNAPNIKVQTIVFACTNDCQRKSSKPDQGKVRLAETAPARGGHRFRCAGSCWISRVHSHERPCAGVHPCRPWSISI